MVASALLRRSYFTDIGGAARFFATMVHEIAHDDDTTGSHVHGEQFYRNFHNLVRYGSCNEMEMDDWQSGGGAFRYVGEFAERMKKAVAQERTEAAQAREAKSKARVDKALGQEQPTRIAAETNVSPKPNRAPVLAEAARSLSDKPQVLLCITISRKRLSARTDVR